MQYIKWNTASNGIAKIAEMRYNLVRLHNLFFEPKYKEDSNTSLFILDIFGQHSQDPTPKMFIDLCGLILEIEGAEEAYVEDDDDLFFDAMVELSERVRDAVEQYSDPDPTNSISVLSRIELALEDIGVEVHSACIDDVITFSPIPGPNCDVIMIHKTTEQDPVYYAEYYSEPIELNGKSILPFTTITNTLNYKHLDGGKWSFIVNEDKGYFCYCQSLGRGSSLTNASHLQLLSMVDALVSYAEDKMLDDLSCIKQLISISNNDCNIGQATQFALSLSDYPSADAIFTDLDYPHVLSLQESYEKNPDIVLSDKDEADLAKLYSYQISMLKNEQCHYRIKIHKHLTNVARRLSQIDC